jgi:hypothetical protein
MSSLAYDFAMFSTEGDARVQKMLNEVLSGNFTSASKAKKVAMIGLQFIAAFHGYSEATDTAVRESVYEYIEIAYQTKSKPSQSKSKKNKTKVAKTSATKTKTNVRTRKQKTDNTVECVEQTNKKYTSRSSPPFPANQCQGQIKTGNDGESYESVPNSKNIHRWVRLA